MNIVGNISPFLCVKQNPSTRTWLMFGRVPEGSPLSVVSRVPKPPFDDHRRAGVTDSSPPKNKA